MGLEFKLISETSKKAFEESLDIMYNKRNYCMTSQMTTTSVVVKDANGDDYVVTTYSILLQKEIK